MFSHLSKGHCAVYSKFLFLLASPSFRRTILRFILHNTIYRNRYSWTNLLFSYIKYNAYSGFYHAFYRIKTDRLCNKKPPLHILQGWYAFSDEEPLLLLSGFNGLDRSSLFLTIHFTFIFSLVLRCRHCDDGILRLLEGDDLHAHGGSSLN